MALPQDSGGAVQGQQFVATVGVNDLQPNRRVRKDDPTLHKVVWRELRANTLAQFTGGSFRHRRDLIQRIKLSAPVGAAPRIGVTANRTAPTLLIEHKDPAAREQNQVDLETTAIWQRQQLIGNHHPICWELITQA